MTAKKKTKPKQKKTPEEWSGYYAILHPTYEAFVSKLADLLSEILDLNRIDCHAIESRTKDIASFQNKIQRPEKSYDDPLEELPDLAGIRIIAYYQDDIVRIRKLVKDEFHIDPLQSSNKADELAADQFGYVSVHEIVRLKPERAGMTEWSRFKELHAEIQIRTVLQHAWASISHKLQYKHEADIPRALRRKLFRISSLMELADEQFSELRKTRQELTEVLLDQVKKDKLDIPLNVDSVILYLKSAFIVSQFNREITRLGGSLAGINDEHYMTNISPLVSVTHQLGLATLSDLDALLVANTPNIPAYFDALVGNQGHLFYETDICYWISMVLIGIDHGQRLTPDTVPWKDVNYTSEIFEIGKRVFGDKS